MYNGMFKFVCVKYAEYVLIRCTQICSVIVIIFIEGEETALVLEVFTIFNTIKY